MTEQSALGKSGYRGSFHTKIAQGGTQIMNKEIAEYHKGNGCAAWTVGAGAIVASAVPTMVTSEPGHLHPLREMDPLGIPNLFDHTGSMDNAALICWTITFAGTFVYEKVSKDKKEASIVGVAAVAGVLSAGAVLAAEMKDVFDTTDALYGGAVSVLYPIIFAISALRRRARMRRKGELGS